MLSLIIQSVNLCGLGRALCALGKKEDALLVWEQGYGYAVRQSADLKQFLELEELLKLNRIITSENHAVESPESSISVSESALHVDEKPHSTPKNDSKLNDESESSDTSEIDIRAFDTSDAHGELRDTENWNGKLNSESNGTYDMIIKSCDESELCSELSDTSEKSSKSSAIYSQSSSISEVQPLGDEFNRNRKFCVTRISKTKSISVDFRLSRGIAQVCFNSSCSNFLL